MKALIRPVRDSKIVYPNEVTFYTQGKGKAATVTLILRDNERRITFDLHEIQSALKGLELACR
jgi:hypothetical protein